MQARINGMKIEDVPTSLDKKSSQSMMFPVEEEQIKIEYHGPIPFIPIRYPTDHDMKNYKWIDLTSSGEWDPYDDKNEKDISNLISMGESENHYFEENLELDTRTTH